MTAGLIQGEMKPGWQRRRLGHLLRFGNGKETAGIEAADGAYPVYGSGGEFKRANDYLYEGPSILFGRKGTLDKPLLVDGRFWTVDTMFYTIPGPEVEPRFIHYWALTVPYHVLSTDTAVPSMTSTDLGQLYLDLPRLETQRAIADYLDRETGEIDAMSADLDEMEALLTERRSTSLAHNLASGGGASAPIASMAQVTLGKMVQPNKKNPSDIAAPYLRAAHVPAPGTLDLSVEPKQMWFSPSELDHLTVHAGDVVVVEGGAGYGRAALVSDDLDGWGFQNSIIRVRAREGVAVGKYIAYALQHAQSEGEIELLVSTATLPHFTAEKVERFRLPFPPLDEQRRIAAEIDRETAEIDAMLADITELRDLLTERRAAVITAAVTGQIDVPTHKETTHA